MFDGFAAGLFIDLARCNIKLQPLSGDISLTGLTKGGANYVLSIMYHHFFGHLFDDRCSERLSAGSRVDGKLHV